MSDGARLIVESLIVPIVVGIVLWAVTARRKDQAAVREVLAKLPKAEAEGEVAEATVQAAIDLADISTLQAAMKTMTDAFNAERQSMARRIDGTVESLQEALSEIDDLREDARGQHRELLDMYRRDQHHARALQALADWLADNLPKLRAVAPTIPDPPSIEPLPPLFVPDDEGPRRRWSDGDTPGRTVTP